MVSLVGYTGFVGSNILAGGKNSIDYIYNSKNICEAYDTQPDILIYAGVRAEKFLANKNPEEDYKNILAAEENISKIAPKKLILISTVDVLNNPNGMDESSAIDTENLNAYGYNRYMLEIWAREHYNDALIIRLPALFGKGLKKNFLYDLINVIPAMIKVDKMDEICISNPLVKEYYKLQDNGFYKINVLTEEERISLKKVFTEIGFTALSFTDSRSKFQFYNLSSLWDDINIALQNDILLWHPATEPISAAEIYKYVKGTEFNNILSNYSDYDYRTKYYSLWNGNNGYIKMKNDILKEIKDFCETFSI
ncbi:MAG: sugar nucleotide-binding protein [Clostridia bacterium]|nr:sugar nucleotide-binding protein [Clostridia bacterium]